MQAKRAATSDGSSGRPAVPPRNFRLLDAIALTAATAAAFGWIRAIDRQTQGGLSQDLWEFLRGFQVEGWQDAGRLFLHREAIGWVLTLFAHLTMPFVTTWTLTLLPLLLLGPRQAWRRRMSRPGSIATYTIITTTTYIGLPTILTSLAGLRTAPELLDLEFMENDILIHNGLAILATWITLSVIRRWNAEPSWIDRFGRVLGIYWVVAGIGTWGGELLIETSQICHPAPSRRFDSLTLAARIARGTLALVDDAMPWVGLGTFCLIPIGLFLGHQGFHRRIRQPGMLAGLSSCSAIAVLVLSLLVVVSTAEGRWANRDDWLPNDWITTEGARYGGLAVLASWTTLLLARRWHAEPGWVDRLGRVIGTLWITAGLAVSVSNALR